MPAQQAEQTALGERILRIFGDAGAEIIAEDLGIIPDFVRESLARLGIPGYRVFRWERHWHQPGQPYRDPAEYPPTSVATSGTHDTEPLVMWWEAAEPEERRAALELPSIRQLMTVEDRMRAIREPSLTPAIRSALLEALCASRSNLMILPIQDVFGWRARINQPATVGDQNWTWKLPWPSDRLLNEPEALGVAQQLRDLAERHGR